MFLSTSGIPQNIPSLLIYLLLSYAIYRLAVVRNLPTPVFAFIPFFQLYMLGQIGDSLKYIDRQVDNLFGRVPLSLALPLVSLAGAVLRYPFSLIASLVISFGELLIFYLIFSFYDRRHCLLFTAVCCLPTLVMALSILSMIPIVGSVFMSAAWFLNRATLLTSMIGPLLILYCLRRRR